MMRQTLFVAVLGCFLLPNESLAQGKPATTVPKVVPESVERKMYDERKMYEEIEVMRRLMRSKLQDLYTARAAAGRGRGREFLYGGASGGMGGSPFGGAPAGAPGGMSVGSFTGSAPHAVESAKIDLDGVYLPGHGIVFSAQVPDLDTLVRTPHSSSPMSVLSCARCHMANPEVQKKFAASLAKQPRPLSEWEKTRRSVLGLKPDAKSRQALSILVCDPGTLAELVLHVLADNGKHLGQLPDNESVTIAVTFRKEATTSKTSPGGMSAMMGGSAHDDLSSAMGPPGLPAGGVAVRSGGGIVFGAGLDSGGVDSRTGRGNPAQAHREYVLLGDLHMKQGKPTSATEAYSRALAALIDPKKITVVFWTNTQESSQKLILELYRKLAQAALAADQIAVAQSHLDRRASLLEWSKLNPRQATSSRFALPSRLIISTRKGLLDQTGREELNFEEFKKQSEVRHLSLNAK